MVHMLYQELICHRIRLHRAMAKKWVHLEANWPKPGTAAAHYIHYTHLVNLNRYIIIEPSQFSIYRLSLAVLCGMLSFGIYLLCNKQVKPPYSTASRLYYGDIPPSIPCCSFQNNLDGATRKHVAGTSWDLSGASDSLGACTDSRALYLAHIRTGQG